jgi:hypothetical protein
MDELKNGQISCGNTAHILRKQSSLVRKFAVYSCLVIHFLLQNFLGSVIILYHIHLETIPLYV